MKAYDITDKDIALYDKVKDNPQMGYYSVNMGWWDKVSGPYIVLKETKGGWRCMTMLENEHREPCKDMHEPFDITYTPVQGWVRGVTKIVNVRKRKDGEWIDKRVVTIDWSR